MHTFCIAPKGVIKAVKLKCQHSVAFTTQHGGLKKKSETVYGMGIRWFARNRERERE